MSIAKILVPISSAADDVSAIMTAFRLGKFFNAHVAALFGHDDPTEALPTLTGPLNGEAMAAVIDGQTEMYRRKADALRKTLAEIHQAEDFTNCSFTEAIGPQTHIVGVAASLSDLMILGSPKDSPDRFEIAVEALMHQRCPLLISKAAAGPFRRIAIGWNGSVPAAHALSAAMPFLCAAKHVDLICMRLFGGPRARTWDVDMYMRVHGIAYSEHHCRADAESASELIECALDNGADLLVVGGFGHGRFRETMFGGITHNLIADPQLPIFLAH